MDGVHVESPNNLSRVKFLTVFSKKWPRFFFSESIAKFAVDANCQIHVLYMFVRAYSSMCIQIFGLLSVCVKYHLPLHS